MCACVCARWVWRGRETRMGLRGFRLCPVFTAGTTRNHSFTTFHPYQAMSVQLRLTEALESVARKSVDGQLMFWHDRDHIARLQSWWRR